MLVFQVMNDRLSPWPVERMVAQQRLRSLFKRIMLENNSPQERIDAFIKGPHIPIIMARCTDGDEEITLPPKLNTIIIDAFDNAPVFVSAACFSPENGRISVELVPDSHWRDTRNGEGIKLPFDRFAILKGILFFFQNGEYHKLTFEENSPIDQTRIEVNTLIPTVWSDIESLIYSLSKRPHVTLIP